jgi:acetylornithine deacetylase/succinyl-diaminopimelate desuccinylase-like protein
MLTPSAAGTQRVLDRLDRVYAIGGGEGANRPAYSSAEDEAIELAAGWMGEAGLDVERDADGNLVGCLHGRRPELPEVWTGSHLDSVPEGGRFDGALGVVAGIEAVEQVGRSERTLGVVSFRGEEVGCLGSHARSASGSLPGTFVELHIEQGPRLARAAAPLAVVTGIVGYAREEGVTFEGSAAHAGTTPMETRDDALCQAAEFILRVRDAARSIDDAVATVGWIAVEPGAANVVPRRATLSVDARAPDVERFERLLAAIGLEPALRTDPIAMDAGVQAVLREEVERLGLPVVELPSGAGHDAGVLAAAGVASGMLFVRSLAGGVSHSPDEHTSAADIERATEVLAATLRRLASVS